MSGDTFNFNSNQTGSGAVTQQAHTISGDAVTTVNAAEVDENKQLAAFFSMAATVAATPTNHAVPGPEAQADVLQVLPQAVSQVTENHPELLVDKTTTADALPLNFVMSELGAQAAAPPEKRDVPLIKQMLRVVHEHPGEAMRIVGRISLAFGKGWLMSTVTKNPVFTAMLAAMDAAETIVNKDKPST